MLIEGIPNINQEIVKEKPFQVPLRLWQQTGANFEADIMRIEARLMENQRSGSRLVRFQDLNVRLPDGLLSSFSTVGNRREPVCDGYVRQTDGRRYFVEVKQGFHHRPGYGRNRYVAASMEQLSALTHGRTGLRNMRIDGGEIWVYHPARDEDIPKVNGRPKPLTRGCMWLQRTIISTRACASLLSQYERRRWVHMRYRPT